MINLGIGLDNGRRDGHVRMRPSERSVVDGVSLRTPGGATPQPGLSWPSVAAHLLNSRELLLKSLDLLVSTGGRLREASHLRDSSVRKQTNERPRKHTQRTSNTSTQQFTHVCRVTHTTRGRREVASRPGSCIASVWYHVGLGWVGLAKSGRADPSGTRAAPQQR